MNMKIQVSIILFIWTLCVHIMPAISEERLKEKDWTGQLGDGTIITIENLVDIFKKAKTRHDYDKTKIRLKTDLRKAQLQGAKLSGKNLKDLDLDEINLSGADLTGADLTKVSLRRANLQGADLNGAILTDAYLPGADLTGAILFGADMKRAYLPNSILRGANLKHADLSKANLEKADLSNTSMRGAKLRETRMAGAKLLSADLGGAKLVNTKMPGADLQGVEFYNGHYGSATIDKVDWQRANLQKVNFRHIINDLIGSNLKDANLSNSELAGAKLKGMNLRNANFMGANLSDADLSDANLQNANLERAILTEASLKGADLSGANLKGANLNGVDLSGVKLVEADLTDAHIREANLSFVYFQPKPGSLPTILHIATANNLSSMYFLESPHALVELREAFKDKGLRKQEREITYAIKHTERLILWKQKGIINKIESLFNLVMFELTCDYGMSPGRAILLLVPLLFLFAILYAYVLRWPPGNEGIWKVWSPDRVRKDLGAEEPVILHLKFFSAIVFGFYFSIISSFSIGWRELNVGNWIARIQPREYTLRASGWVRTVAGIQSLISVYLLALWVLTYFGRPFE